MVVMAVILSAGAAVAQDEGSEEVVKDDIEVSIYGGLGVPSGGITNFEDSLGAKSGVLVGGGIGYFPTRSLVIGLGVTYTQFGIESNANLGGQDHRLISPHIYGKYYFFGGSDLVPYIKGSLGVDIANFSSRVYDNGTARFVFRQLSYEPALAWQVSAGLHYYTFDYGGIFLEAGYHGAVSSDAIVDYQDVRIPFGESIGQIDIRAGITVFFGSE